MREVDSGERCRQAGAEAEGRAAGPACAMNYAWIYYWIYTKRRTAMTGASQKRALKNYRRRLGERGMARFEVLGLAADRALIRALAKRLAENDGPRGRIRAAVSRSIAGKAPKKGGI